MTLTAWLLSDFYVYGIGCSPKTAKTDYSLLAHHESVEFRVSDYSLAHAYGDPPGTLGLKGNGWSFAFEPLRSPINHTELRVGPPILGFNAGSDTIAGSLAVYSQDAVVVVPFWFLALLAALLLRMTRVRSAPAPLAPRPATHPHAHPLRHLHAAWMPPVLVSLLLATLALWIYTDLYECAVRRWGVTHYTFTESSEALLFEKETWLNPQITPRVAWGTFRTKRTPSDFADDIYRMETVSYPPTLLGFSAGPFTTTDFTGRSSRGYRLTLPFWSLTALLTWRLHRTRQTRRSLPTCAFPLIP
jgi:hypothetical protein